MIDIYTDLSRRLMPLDRRGLHICPESNSASFLMYNLSGQIVGVQTYRPNGTKLKNNSIVGRYHTERHHDRNIAVWGMDTIALDSAIFVCEGIFDANRLHLMGLPAIATMVNETKSIVHWLRALGRPSIAITDNDAPGRRLGKYTNYAFSVPDPYGDLDEMPQRDVETFIGTILHQI